MFNRLFGRRPNPDEEPKKNNQEAEQTGGADNQRQEVAPTLPPPPAPPPLPQPLPQRQPEPAPQRFGFLNRTRQLFSRMNEDIEQSDTIDNDLWDNLEEALLSADVGPRTSEWLMDRLHERVEEEHLRTGAQVKQALRQELSGLLGKPSSLRFSKQSPITVVLVIGVNGSGKTTTIAKLAYRLKNEGHNVLLAAGDTFRAAAIDQLEEWGRRVEVPVIRQNPGSDSGAVVFDALQAARSRNSDVVLIDTAGRLQTKYNLMEELKKLNKIIQRFVPDGPHEILIVIDATTGQNALLQARQFAADIGLTGVVVTKLDGTSKGGFAFAVADDLGVPIKFIGTGEKLQDLTPFDPQGFVAALFAQD